MNMLLHLYLLAIVDSMSKNITHVAQLIPVLIAPHHLVHTFLSTCHSSARTEPFEVNHSLYRLDFLMRWPVDILEVRRRGGELVHFLVLALTHKLQGCTVPHPLSLKRLVTNLHSVRLDKLLVAPEPKVRQT